MDKEPTPRKLEREKGILFEPPKHIVTILLPRIEERTFEYIKGGGEYVDKELLLGMHTDMLGRLLNGIETLKETTQSRLLVEGRYLNAQQWRKLQKSQLWKYFWSRRGYRAEDENQRRVMKLIVPKNVKISEEEMRKYAFMKFSPETFSEKFGFKTAWYPARKLLDRSVNSGFGSNSLERILGGCNQFRIGSNSLSPALINLSRGRITEQFRGYLDNAVRDKVLIEDKILAKIARVIQV